MADRARLSRLDAELSEMNRIAERNMLKANAEANAYMAWLRGVEDLHDALAAEFAHDATIRALLFEVALTLKPRKDRT